MALMPPFISGKTIDTGTYWNPIILSYFSNHVIMDFNIMEYYRVLSSMKHVILFTICHDVI